MACKNVCRLCDRLVLSSSVTFATATGLVINIPQATYTNGEKYCIVVAQPIPATATIAANAYITIGSSTTLYPLVDCSGAQLSACDINTRTKYSTRVTTTPTGGVFKLIGTLSNHDAKNLPSLPVA